MMYKLESSVTHYTLLYLISLGIVFHHLAAVCVTETHVLCG